MLDKLLQLNKRRMEHLFEDSENRYTGSKMYIDEMKQEIVEMQKELRPNNTVHLEDELGDVLWDYLCLLHGLEQEGLIDSLEQVWQRAYTKYSERLADYPDHDRQGVKARQKKSLADEHQKRYGE